MNLLILGFALLWALTTCGATETAEASASGADSEVTSKTVSEALVASQEETPAEAFEEIVVLDNEVCSFIIKDADPDNDWGYTMPLYLVNKTDKTLFFSIDNAAVNGYMCDPYWSATVPAGKQAFSKASWSTDDFDINGITQVEEIVLPFTVYDDDAWEVLLEETYTVNP